MKQEKLDTKRHIRITFCVKQTMLTNKDSLEYIMISYSHYY